MLASSQIIRGGGGGGGGCSPSLFLCLTSTIFIHLYLICVLRAYQIISIIKGRFLMFRRNHNFANLFSKLSESTFYKEISKFQ